MANVLVVGGGAAGLMAAWRAAQLGHQVQVLEANTRVGVKIRISGGGKCNVTHAGRPADLQRAFPKSQGRFLREAFHRFDSDALCALLRERGVDTYTRDNGRVFPLDQPGSAAQVVSALEGLVRDAGVTIRIGIRVKRLEGGPPHLVAVVDEGERPWTADNFILATGGASYPETGTRGEMAGQLRALGLPVRPWAPALAPIPLVNPRPDWEGVALREGSLDLWAGPSGRRMARFAGDLLFTRTGITGPAALELSEATESLRREGQAWLSYALSSESAESLDLRLVDLTRLQPHLAARNWLHQWLPERLCQPLVVELGLDPDQRLKDLNRSARRALVGLITGLPLGAPRAVPLERGEVAAGGLRLEGVDPRTMAVQGWDNLRVCGELLDINGPVGGYNLQAAFSTGFLAGSI